MKRKLSILAMLASTGPLWAQRTHPGHYLYHGQRVEVPVCDEAVLVYFRTTVMPAEEVQHRYRCLREVRLNGRKADTLFATVVAVEGDYAAALEALRARPEVWDVEPVLGKNGEVPVSNVFYVLLKQEGDEAVLAEMAQAAGARHEGRTIEGTLWHTVSVDKHSEADALALSTRMGESGRFADVDPGFVPQIEYYDVPCVSDSMVNQQWGLEAIHACQAWQLTTGTPSVKLAISDTGVDTNHREFQGLNVASSIDATFGTTPAYI